MQALQPSNRGARRTRSGVLPPATHPGETNRPNRWNTTWPKTFNGTKSLNNAADLAESQLERPEAIQRMNFQWFAIVACRIAPTITGSDSKPAARASCTARRAVGAMGFFWRLQTSASCASTYKPSAQAHRLRAAAFCSSIRSPSRELVSADAALPGLCPPRRLVSHRHPERSQPRSR